MSWTVSTAQGFHGLVLAKRRGFQASSAVQQPSQDQFSQVHSSQISAQYSRSSQPKPGQARPVQPGNRPAYNTRAPDSRFWRC